MDDRDRYDVVPGKMEGLDGFGKGVVTDISVGKEFTCVVTAKYEGPSKAELDTAEREARAYERHEAKKREKAEKERRRLEIIAKAEAEKAARLKQDRMHPLCDMEGCRCTGWEPQPLNQNKCRVCDHARIMHKTDNPKYTKGTVEESDDPMQGKSKALSRPTTADGGEAKESRYNRMSKDEVRTRRGRRRRRRRRR